MFGLITGSGFYDIAELQERAETAIETPYGEPVIVTTGMWNGNPVCFLPRHGRDHSIPPHAINYRANIAALKACGATRVLATAVSGGMRPDLVPGSFVLISDYLNFSSGRADTFFDGEDRTGLTGAVSGPAQSDGNPVRVVHADMSTPYDEELSAIVKEAAALESVTLLDGATYCTADGPRFETKAEIEMMAKLGGDLVGMTGYPEVALAVEAGLPYVSIGVISNLAAGLSDEALSVAEIVTLIETSAEPLYRLIGRTVQLCGDQTDTTE